MKNIPYLITLLLVLTSTLFANYFVKAGTLDLRDAQFDAQNLFILKGYAPLYWQKHCTYQNLSTYTPDAQIPIPGIWNGTEIHNQEITGIGYGTIAVKVLLPHKRPKQVYALKVGTILSAYRLYIDTTLIKKVGIAGTSIERTKSDYDPSVCLTPPVQDSFTLILQISNFEDMKGGPWQPIFIGTPEAVTNASMLNQIYDIFFIALFLIFAAINIVNYFLLHPYDKSFHPILYLAIFSFIIALRTGLTGERVFYHLFPTIPLDIMLLIEYLAFFFAVNFYHRYIHSVFEQWSARWYANALTYISTTLALLTILTPLSFNSRFIPLYQGVMFVTILYHTVITFRAFSAGAFKSTILAISSLSFLITATLDILRDHTLGVAIPLIPFGASLVVISQAILVLRNNKTIFQNNVNTTKALTATNRTLERFVPQQFFAALHKDALSIKLGDHAQKKMSVLFCDIRQFSTISEHMSSKQTFLYINKYLALITPIIQKNNGFIDKFIGDAVVALFPNSSSDATNAACSIQRELHSSRLHSNYAITFPLQIGIGLHYDTMTIGIIGDENRMDSTVMGDAVNTASRVEQLTKVFGVDTIITKSVLLNLSQEAQKIFHFRLLAELTLRGKSEKVTLYELYSVENHAVFAKREKAKHHFESGVHFYLQGEYAQAYELFTKALSDYPEDKAAVYYLKQCKNKQKSE